MILVGMVLIGGIRWISEIAGKLVLLMTVTYFAAGVVVLAVNITALLAAFGLILEYVFTPIAAQDGFAGAAVWMAIHFGVARGVFSNVARLGCAVFIWCQSHNPLSYCLDTRAVH